MSAYKSHKTELVAIYRLEFYKKQKNWKFSHDAIKTPRKTPKPKKVLNKTYNIEVEPEKECISPHNQGFIEEKAVAAIVNKTPEQELKDTPNQEPITYLPINSPNHDVQCEQNSQTTLIYMEPKIDNPNWLDAEQEWYEDSELPETMAPQQYECGAGEMGWPNVGFNWAQDSPLQPDWPQADIIRGGQPINQMQFTQQWDELQYTEGEQSSFWMQRDTVSDVCHMTSSTDSFSEFVRGARAAPHSSEVDMLQDTGWSSCGCSLAPVRPSRLSARQLAAGVCAHSRALTLLLHETTLRNQRAMSPTTPLFPHTPGSPQRSATFTTDAGSSEGRGRGRLRDKLIGIGMGRPFRL